MDKRIIAAAIIASTTAAAEQSSTDNTKREWRSSHFPLMNAILQADVTQRRIADELLWLPSRMGAYRYRTQPEFTYHHR